MEQRKITCLWPNVWLLLYEERRSPFTWQRSDEGRSFWMQLASCSYAMLLAIPYNIVPVLQFAFLN